MLGGIVMTNFCLGEFGEAKLIVSVSLGGSAVFQMEASVPVLMMKDTCAVSAMVTYLSWMADVRTSFFIVRILVGNRNGSTYYVPLDQTTCFLLSFVQGRSGMLFANVCAGFIRSCYEDFWVWHFLGFLASLLCLVCWGVLALPASLLHTRLGFLCCASCWTRLF